ncbi:uncharacterized protein A4U43_C05F21520 [Asparagus officinalis]|uniref:Uncharacterized protein n=1 Tax=Asparagus officinalis TaxID=4686 RepID=A0A5P1EXS6_ASPOF|nr:uncharacterized protein A4U43_C05F21520 [Asparagus officinalis]
MNSGCCSEVAVVDVEGRRRRCGGGGAMWRRRCGGGGAVAAEEACGRRRSQKAELVHVVALISSIYALGCGAIAG